MQPANKGPFVFDTHAAMRCYEFSMTYQTATAYRFLAGNG
jgi:hypothetical protein